MATFAAYLNMPGSRVCQRGALRGRIKPDTPPLACAVAALPDVGAATVVAVAAVVALVAVVSALVRDAGLTLSS
jgi:hypothetical protein